MRKAILCLSLVAAFLLAGCSGGGVESDLKKTPEEVRAAAEKMSVADIETRIGELEKKSDELKKKVGEKEPSEEEMKQAVKLVEVGGIYATELVKRKLK